MYKRATIAIFCAGIMVAQTSTQSNIGSSRVTKSEPHLQLDTVTLDMADTGMGTVVAASAADIAGEPYSAQVETSRVQILGDGNRIEQTTSGSVARDAQGRVRREESLPGIGNGQGETARLTFIDDPVAKVHWTLDSMTKTATKLPFDDSERSSGMTSHTAHTLPSLGTPALPRLTHDKVLFVSSTPGKGDVQIAKIIPDGDNAVTKTDLGVQSIEGVKAEGTRITRTIPAAMIGNTLPIKITTETWFSPELRVLLLSKTNDPRIGETIYRLTGIVRADPPAALFEVPPDYKVKPATVTFTLQTPAKE